MLKKRRKKKKLHWWTKAKRWMLELISRREKTKLKRRKKRRRKSTQSLSLQKIWQNVFLPFKPERRRRRKKRPLAKRIGRSCLKLAISLQQQIKKLFATQKRKKRRKRRQYAVYVMANQKKVDRS